MTLIVFTVGIFAIGLYGVLSRRDLVAVLASIEIMLGGATMLLVGLAMTAEVSPVATDPSRIEAIGVLILVLAAAEASVALALVVAVARHMRTTRVDEVAEVRG